MRIQLILFFIFIIQVFSDATIRQEEVHKSSRYPFLAVNDNLEVTIISPELASDKSLASQYDKKGEILSEDKSLTPNFPPNSKVVVPHTTDTSLQGSYVILYTNKNSDVISTYSQGRLKYANPIKLSKVYVKKSLVALKNGLIFSAGVGEKNELTEIDVNLYDPKTNKLGTGLSFGVHGKFISCYEQEQNKVYCAYVVQEYPYVSKLSLQLLEVNPTANTITSNGEQIIKTFYTVFNFIKAVPFNEKEAIILFKTGDGNNFPRYRNEGSELYYYHIQVSKENLVTATRYDFLSEGECKLRKGQEDESVDIGVLSENEIYIACEDKYGKLKGFMINPKVKGFEEFNFYDFNAKEIRNPTFAKFCYFSNTTKLIPVKYSLNDVDFKGKVFMINPYKASKMSQTNYVKFGNFSGIKMVDILTNKTIESGKIYNSSKLILKITPISQTGYYSIPFTSILKDGSNNFIEGKVCKMGFITPKCLEQCDSCVSEGTDEFNDCLECKNDSYFRKDYETKVIVDNYSPHNCERCNESCYNCWGAFFETPSPNTNCKKCDYKNGYYHFFADEKICISYETYSYWKEVLGHSMYLDKTQRSWN